MRSASAPSCCLPVQQQFVHRRLVRLLYFAFYLFSLAEVVLGSNSHEAANESPSSRPSKPRRNSFAEQLTSPSPLAKRLLELNACISDANCWGVGRRCVEGRCWGFAGPHPNAFECQSGTVCTLERINGHFFGEGSRGTRGLFMLQVINGPLSSCGSCSMRDATQNNAPFLCEDGDTDCFLAAAGEGAQAIKGSSAPAEGQTLVLGAPMRCLYTAGLSVQPTCSVRLGFLPPTLPVGSYALCGCSSTDLGGNGQPCSSEADFSVPVGTVNIKGFEGPVVSKLIPAASPAGAAGATGSGENVTSIAATLAKGDADEEPEKTTDVVEEREPLEVISFSNHRPSVLLPRFSCSTDLPCELPGIRGFGLDTQQHFIRAFSGAYASCEEAAKVSSASPCCPCCCRRCIPCSCTFC